MNVGARDAGMENVADDRDLQTGDASLSFTDGQSVEQGLRRVFVRAVSGVDDATNARELLRRACGRVSDDDAVRSHRFEVARRVEQGLAFRDARS